MFDFSSRQGVAEGVVGCAVLSNKAHLSLITITPAIKTWSSHDSGARSSLLQLVKCHCLIFCTFSGDLPVLLFVSDCKHLSIVSDAVTHSGFSCVQFSDLFALLHL